MQTIAQTIFRKYTHPPEVTKKSRLIVRLALEEFDEIYQDAMLAAADERQQLQTRLAVALDAVRGLEQQRDDDGKLITELLAALDATEAECQRVKTTTNGASSAPTIAPMVSSAPAAQSISSGPAPMPSSPAASITAVAPIATPASPASGKLSEVSSDPNFFPLPLPAWWPDAIASFPAITNLIPRLDAGQVFFNRLPPYERFALLTWWLKSHSPHLKMSQFDNQRPPWMSTATAVTYLAPQKRWNHLLRMAELLRSTAAPITGPSSPKPPAASASS